MEPKNNLETCLAAELARKFLLPGQSGQPLSFRMLPDGGMVVIVSDGRKLWFTIREVNTARGKLGIPQVKPGAPQPGGLIERDQIENLISASKLGCKGEGVPLMIVLPESLKHLDRRANGRANRDSKPRSDGA
jgi:hypothetical protein